MTTHSTTTEAALEPCPWCKAVPRAIGHYFEVFHQPECFLSEFSNALTRKLIHANKFDTWNSRIPAPGVAPEVDEALRKFLESYKEPCAGDCEHETCPLLRQLHALRISATLDRVDREQAAWAAHGAVSKHECVNPARTANVASDAYYAVINAPAPASPVAPVEQSAAARCPNCGARLTSDFDEDVGMWEECTECDYRNALSSRAAPASPAALRDEAAINQAIDAMRVAQRLFDLSDNHILMVACRRLEALDTAATTTPPSTAKAAAEEIVGTVFDNTGASHETLKQTMIERIEQYLIERCFSGGGEGK